MPVDVESELARLGAAWSASVAHVDVAEVLERTMTARSQPIDEIADPPVTSSDRLGAESRSHGWGQRWMVAAACATLVVAGVVTLANRRDGGPEPALINASTDPTKPSTTMVPIDTVAPLPEPFVGGWVSTDTDGSTQTIEIVRSGGDDYELVLRDDVATVCSGAPATMTGTGRLETDERLVIAQPELTCDDGTIPRIGPPPQVELANFTLELNTETDQFVDIYGVVWQRAGSTDEPVAPSPVTVPALAPGTSGGMWPQSTLDEVRAAQELADAGDPGYTWQVGAELSLVDRWAHLDELEIVDRFLREVLGWEAYLFNSRESGDETGNGEGDGWAGGVAGDLEFLRCVPNLTNPLYPPHADGRPGTSCAPTLDDLHYESVRLDLAQLDREGLDGVWVVNRWMLTAPFAQTDPAALSAQVTQRLEEWLAARLAGEGAEGQVASNGDLPLLYATTSGARYERYEIERLDVGGWPDGDGATFRVRLFADGGTTVVEQEIGWNPGFGLPMSVVTTTENGESVARSVSSEDGEVTATVLDPWNAGSSHPEVWAWGLSRLRDNEVGVFIGFADPVAYDSWCAALGGSPVLSAPADAAAVAQAVMVDPNFETTAPVGVRVGGVDAISIDVGLAPGGRAPCGDGFEGSSLPWQVGGRWIHELSQPGRRLRIYLVDLPEGMSVQTMAITVVAPEERFVEVIDETKPIIDSIEFHPG